MQFLEGIEKLVKHINSDDAESFRAWSNRYAEQSVRRRLSVYIKHTNQNNEEKLSLSEYEVKNWVNMWTHPQLAKVVSTIWNGEKHATHKDLDDAYNEYQVNINSPKMNINNVEEKQKVVFIISDTRVFRRNRRARLYLRSLAFTTKAK
jgi:hypothetical protein